MNNDDNYDENNQNNSSDAMSHEPSDLNGIDALSQYLKSAAGEREGRAIPPLENWHPKDIADMDLVIKANGEWWHEGGKMTRQSLVNLFATILWKEENNGASEYFLKTPVQKLRIQVEDAPLLINDVGIVQEGETSWLEFTTTTGDVVRLDNEHVILLKTYDPKTTSTTNHANIADNHAAETEAQTEAQVRPYIPVRNGLTALIGRNTFYHLTEIGKLTENGGETILTLQSGGRSYSISMPAE